MPSTTNTPITKWVIEVP